MDAAAYFDVSTGDAGDWEWVNGERLVDARLEVVTDGQVADERALTPYEVEQVPGREWYDVVEFDADAEDAPPAPDFEAYPIQLETSGEQYEIRLVSDQGEVLDGSARQVRVPANPPVSRLLLIPVAPLLIGAAVITRRQSRAKLSRAAG